ncbi:MAG: ATP-binding protein, partial [Clostridia bacterium]|nr:ATP-binding protein [Clostridia bacterium]
FEKKYTRARSLADERAVYVRSLIPEIAEIDRVLSRTGMDIMAIINSDASDKEKEISELEKRNNELIAKRNKLLTDHGFAEDYTDVKYECQICGDTGYTETGMCDCMKRAIAKEGYMSSGLGTLIGEQTFDNFDLSYYNEDNKKRVEQYVGALREFSENFNNDTYQNYILIGTTGLGKTHLSTAVAQNIIDRGYDVLYVSSVKMLGDFEAQRFGNDMGQTSTGLSRYYEADLLIIDDLGAEVINQFTHTYLYNVINSRMSQRKSTIINTNFYPKELNQMYTERISSRIMGEYMPMLFKGIDIRKKKNGLGFKQ